MNTYLWLFRREVWENRAIWMLPAAVSAVLLFIFLFGKIQVEDLPQHLTAEQIAVVAPMFFSMIAVLMLSLMSVYTAWYLLDCLYADRKDRSVLFWKSLPVTDTSTVLSKLAMALFVIPLVYFIAADVTALGAAFILSVRGGSHFTAALWNPANWLHMQVLSLYMIVTSALWFLPVSAWFLLVSAWANRAVTLWAVVAPAVLCFVEDKLLGTHYLLNALGAHFLGYLKTAFRDAEQYSSVAPDGSDFTVPRITWRLIDPASFFSSVEMWVGVALGVAFVAGAIYLRQRRTEA